MTIPMKMIIINPYSLIKVPESTKFILVENDAIVSDDKKTAEIMN